MQCNRCRDEPVIFQPYSGRHLCRDHFITDFEIRAKRVIRQYRWLLPGDRIAVPLTGDPASRSLFLFLQRLTAGRRDVSVSAVACDSAPYPQGIDPEQAAARCGATRVALPASVDDMAVSVLRDFLGGCKGELPLYAELHQPDSAPSFRIYPFCQIPEDEILLYASLQGIERTTAPHPVTRGASGDEVRAMLDGFTGAHPGTKYAVANLGRELAGCLARRDEG
jgi:tRNA(Ile)-lysidine synthase TilS/MesJ